MAIDNLVVGDDFDFDILITDVPAGQLVISGWLTVKRYDSDLDDDKIFQSIINTTLTNNGQITISGIYTRALFSIGRTNTRLLSPAGEYVYDVQILTNGNKIKTVDKGTIIPVQDVTRVQ